MIEALRGEWVYLWYYMTIQFRQIAPYYALGIALGSALSVFAKGRIHGLVASMGQRKLGLLGVVPASLLGIASPLCLYGTIPLAASFARLGVAEDWLAAFMMSSILLNPQLIAYSAALGPALLAARIAASFLCGAAAGLCVRFFFKGRAFFNFTGFKAPENHDTDPRLPVRLLKNTGRNLRATGGWFALGVALSAAFQRYVPPSFVESLFGNNNGFGVLMAATVGVPLYACGGATVPLLSQWLASGMTAGGAVAFMITGPATKITNLGAMKIVLGGKRFLLYLLFAALFALLAGAAVDAGL